MHLRFVGSHSCCLNGQLARCSLVFSKELPQPMQHRQLKGAVPSRLGVISHSDSPARLREGVPLASQSESEGRCRRSSRPRRSHLSWPRRSEARLVEALCVPSLEGLHASKCQSAANHHKT